MGKYKLIASDMDGTLLNKSSTISRENTQAIHTLVEKGVSFVPITGRSFAEIIPEILENPDIRFIVCSNGAHIVDKLTGKSTLTCLSSETLRGALDTINEYDTCVLLHQNGKTVADGEKLTIEGSKYFRTPDRYKDFIDAYGGYIYDFGKKSYELENVEMITMFFRNDDEMEECRERLRARGDLIVAAAFKHSLEIISSQAGKGNGLRKVAQLLDVNIQDTIGVGDSANDITLIQAAGLGLAVGNAWDELKAEADAIICTNEEHIAEYILNNCVE